MPGTLPKPSSCQLHVVALEVAHQHVQPQPQSATGDGLHPEPVLTAVDDVVIFEAHCPACTQPVRQGYLQSAAVANASQEFITSLVKYNALGIVILKA